jgi:hypothetical protein
MPSESDLDTNGGRDALPETGWHGRWHPDEVRELGFICRGDLRKERGDPDTRVCGFDPCREVLIPAAVPTAVDNVAFEHTSRLINSKVEMNSNMNPSYSAKMCA